MNHPILPIQHALISVFDKTGLEPLCQKLKAQGTQIYSTGGTAKFISEQGLEVIPVETITRFPEMMDGRVKTLHPNIFGGILARRSEKEDLAAAERHQIPLFDLIVVNLYPFWDHLNDTKEVQTKFIDIGGPSMLRAAAKNHASVVVLSSPTDYEEFINELDQHRGTSLRFRESMAAKTFRRTSEYDLMIANCWEKVSSELPNQISLGELTPLRYGENPHQKAAWGAKSHPWKVLQGKELSYNNLLDAESAVRLTYEFKEPAITIIKHNNPCGVASLEAPLDFVFDKALNCDAKSAFGGIVSSNRWIDGKTAEAMSKIFFEVVIAPGFSEEAKVFFSQKKNLRLIAWENPALGTFEIRPSMGGWLVQTSDNEGMPLEARWVTQQSQVSSATQSDLMFAWLVAKHVRSNAIVIAKDGHTVGIGAGQMSRVDAVQLALEKAKGKT
ncbi:MAG: bifunctional phosphoribosylaminoimidazolecarboxamide formyltransferase/IMP cyclohydrolase, partial [Deltaproteobacteria bacterium]